MKEVDWREIADELAKRLYFHARCKAHSGDRPRDNCPLCLNKLSYEKYLKMTEKEEKKLKKKLRGKKHA